MERTDEPRQIGIRERLVSREDVHLAVREVRGIGAGHCLREVIVTVLDGVPEVRKRCSSESTFRS